MQFDVILMFCRENGKLRNLFHQRFIEDKTDSSYSYQEYLQHIHKEIKDWCGGAGQVVLVVVWWWWYWWYGEVVLMVWWMSDVMISSGREGCGKVTWGRSL